MEVKEIDLTEVVLKQFKDKEVIHFVSKQLDVISRSISKDSTPENMYKNMGAILRANEFLKAVDQRMNRAKKSVVVQ